MNKLIHNRAFARALGSPGLQPIWEKLLKLALFGMNYGGGYGVDQSGEDWVLGRLSALHPSGRGGRRPVVFDVGANNGGYVTLLRSILGDRAEVHCFEPSRSSHASLMEKVGQAPGVSIWNFGLSDRPGSAPLFSDANGSPVASLHPGTLMDMDLSQSREDCRLETLDDFCEGRGIGLVDLLKIDVEGNEKHVLLGASGRIEAGAIPLIQFEFGEAQLNSRCTFRDLFELLAPRYQIHRVLRAGLAPIVSYDAIREIYRTSNYLAISRARPELFAAFGLKTPSVSAAVVGAAAPGPVASVA